MHGVPQCPHAWAVARALLGFAQRGIVLGSQPIAARNLSWAVVQLCNPITLGPIYKGVYQSLINQRLSIIKRFPTINNQSTRFHNYHHQSTIIAILTLSIDICSSERDPNRASQF